MRDSSYTLDLSRPRNLWIPDLSQVLFAIVMVKCFVDFFVSYDTFWHIKAGEWIWHHWQIPTTDLGQAIGNQPLKWDDHEWLAQVFMYPMYLPGGFLGLRALMALIPAVLFQSVYRRLRCSGAPPLAAFISVLIAGAATAHHWLARPHMLAYLCLLGSLYFWNRIRNGDRHAWIWLLLVQIVWANLHASFILQFAIGSVYLIEAAVIRKPGSANKHGIPFYIGLFLLLFIGSLMNPYGWRAFAAPLSIVLVSQTRIEEWQPFGLTDLSFYALLGYVVLLALALWKNRREVILPELLIFLGVTFMGFSAGRHAAVTVLATLPAFLRHVPPLFKSEGAVDRSGERDAGSGLTSWISKWNRIIHRWEQRFRGGHLTRAAWCAILLIGFSTTYGPTRGWAWDGINHGKFPVEATRFLESKEINGRIFTDYGWAAYMLFELSPESQVFIDGRAEMYGPERFDEYLTTIQAEPGGLEVLQRHGVNVVVVDPRTKLAKELLLRRDWVAVYQGPKESVYLARSELAGRSM